MNSKRNNLVNKEKISKDATDEKKDSKIIIEDKIDTTTFEANKVEFVIEKKVIKKKYSLKRVSFSSLSTDAFSDTLFLLSQIVEDFSCLGDTSIIVKSLSLIQDNGYDLLWRDNDTLRIIDYGTHNLYGLDKSKIFYLYLTVNCSFYFIYSKKQNKLIIFTLDEMILFKGFKKYMIKGRFVDTKVNIYSYFVYKKDRFYAVNIPKYAPAELTLSKNKTAKRMSLTTLL